MRSSRRSSSAEDAEKAVRIEKIVDDVMRQRSAGIDLDDSAIERQHPDLMPELGQRLRTLRAIEAAARQARQSPSSEAPIAGENCPFEEDLNFLRSTLTSYDILERVNYGGQGVVYKAIQRSTRRTVAIKVLLDGPLATERQRHRFTREVEIISRLQHPNIVTLYESGVVRGRVYFAMEYVEGVPIDDYALLHDLSIPDIVRMFITVARAASHAHQQGIIHRDLNPGNILVDLDGVPRILDFGLAKDVWSDDDARDRSFITIPGQVVGTLPYLSPEQADVQDGEVDVRSDIYALGVVLFELLTGGFPYPIDDDPAAVRANIISREPLKLRKALSPDRLAREPRRNSIIRDLEVILLKALSKEKVRRYQSAAAFAEDLERSLAGDAVEARADSRYYLLRRTLHKYRAAVAVAVLFLLVLSASTVAVTMMWVQARAQRDNARTMTRMALGTLDDVITDIDESIRPLAGGMEVRDRLLNDVVADRLARLRPLVESDVAMEDVRAALHEKQGDIAYARGSHADAAESYQAFLDLSLRELQSRPTTDKYLRDVARAHRKLARVTKDAGQHFERSIEFGQTLVKRYPDEIELKHSLCATRVEFGRHLYLTGQYERAAEHIDIALATAKAVIASNSEDKCWTDLLAKAYEWDGDIRIKLGEGRRSIHSLTKALRLHRELSEARPADVNRRHRVLITCVKLGSILRDDGRVEEATAILEEAVSAGRYLTRVDPTVATWKRDLFGAHQRLAQMSLAGGELERAQSHCDVAVDLAEDLVSREPVNVAWRVILACSHAVRGQVILEKGEPRSAYDEFERALVIREELCAENPNDLTLKERLAASYTWLGWCSRELGRPQHALEHYQRAYDIAEALFALQPAVTQRAVELILSKIRLAVGYIQLDTPEGNGNAVALLEEAAVSLNDLRVSGKLAGRSGVYDSWMDAIRKNQTLLAKRAEEGLEK